MNKSTWALLALIIVVVVAAPVIAGEGRHKNGAGKCSILKQYDKRSKSCRWKF
jgi:hypothetical protein